MARSCCTGGEILGGEYLLRRIKEKKTWILEGGVRQLERVFAVLWSDSWEKESDGRENWRGFLCGSVQREVGYVEDLIMGELSLRVVSRVGWGLRRSR